MNVLAFLLETDEVTPEAEATLEARVVQEVKPPSVEAGTVRMESWVVTLAQFEECI